MKGQHFSKYDETAFIYMVQAVCYFLEDNDTGIHRTGKTPPRDDCDSATRFGGLVPAIVHFQILPFHDIIQMQNKSSGTGFSHALEDTI